MDKNIADMVLIVRYMEILTNTLDTMIGKFGFRRFSGRGRGNLYSFIF